MTEDTNNKLRAVFLAALMVLWVFAGTVAFAGGAAAVSDGGELENVQASPNDPSTDALTTYTVSTGFNNTSQSQGEAPPNSGIAAVELDFSDAGRFGGDVDNFSGAQDVTVQIEDAQGNTRNVPLRDTSASDDNVSLDFENKENVTDGANLTVQFDNAVIKNPSVEETYTLTLRSYTAQGFSGDFEAGTDEYDIQGTGGGGADDRPTDADFSGGSTRWKGQILDF